MPVKLSSDQERVIRDVWAEGDAVGATPMERLAAVLATGVESNHRELDYGDRDSVGPFQQRATWGSRSQRTGARTSAKAFYDAAKAARQRKRYTRADELAADVQRPDARFRGRYRSYRPMALEIIKQLGLNGGSSSGGGTGLAADLNAPDEQQFDPTRGPVSLLEMARPVAPAGTAPAAPAAAALAQPVMPESYPGAPQSGSPGSLMPQQASAAAAPDYSTSFGGDQPAAAGSGSGSADEVAPSGNAAPRVRIARGANVSGRPIDGGVLDLLDSISSAAGREITVTTGTNHNRLTVDGRVSEHSTGHAVDVASTGRELTDGATDALLTVARGKTVQWLRNDGRAVSVRLTAANTRKLVEAGGIFNVPHGKGRIQVIANTHQGGDHTNHWHLGLREG